MKNPRILFILGSGVSLQSGVPTVNDLTRKIFEADEALLPEWFYSENAKKEFQGIQSFIGLLKREYERSGKVANYEDLFSMCQKIYEYETAISTDGSIIRFRDHIYRESAHLWRSYKDGWYMRQAPLGALAEKATLMITACLNAILSKFKDPKGLDLLVETVQTLGADSVDVLTLNHDCLVEYLFDKHGIPYTCGFDPATHRDGDVDWFDEAAFESSERVRIIKLHGSCDWLRLCKEFDEGPKAWHWGRSHDKAKFRHELKDEYGTRLCDDPWEHSALTGSTTKTEVYTRGIFGVLSIEARKLMREHKSIICSGYGWRDNGFNWMIKEWAEIESDRKLLLLHQRDNMGSEFRNPWLWPKDWSWDTPVGWLDWHPNWLRDTRFIELKVGFYPIRSDSF
jgi:hypothetical protein